MEEIITAAWDLVYNLLASTWSLVLVSVTWVGDMLYQLHDSAPRLEGLLVGVLLAWLLLRRDQHPILRVLSSPLKLVVDILDLTWNQAMEVISDLWGTAWGWVNGAWNKLLSTATGTLSWVKNKVVDGYNCLINLLKNIKDKLSSKKEE